MGKPLRYQNVKWNPKGTESTAKKKPLKGSWQPYPAGEGRSLPAEEMQKIAQSKCLPVSSNDNRVGFIKEQEIAFDRHRIYTHEELYIFYRDHQFIQDN